MSNEFKLSLKSYLNFYPSFISIYSILNQIIKASLGSPLKIKLNPFYIIKHYIPIIKAYPWIKKEQFCSPPPNNKMSNDLKRRFTPQPFLKRPRTNQNFSNTLNIQIKLNSEELRLFILHLIPPLT